MGKARLHESITRDQIVSYRLIKTYPVQPGCVERCVLEIDGRQQRARRIMKEEMRSDFKYSNFLETEKDFFILDSWSGVHYEPPNLAEAQAGVHYEPQRNGKNR